VWDMVSGGPSHGMGRKCTNMNGGIGRYYPRYGKISIKRTLYRCTTKTTKTGKIKIKIKQPANFQ